MVHGRWSTSEAMHRREGRALHAGCAFAFVLVCGLVHATAARCEDDGLKPVAEALAAVRATPATNTKLDAGPELTPVKDRLRAWIEQRLSTLAEDGDQAAFEVGEFLAPPQRCRADPHTLAGRLRVRPQRQQDLSPGRAGVLPGALDRALPLHPDQGAAAQIPALRQG